MSSIRKRNGKYQAQVRINGASVTRSFRTKSEASSWSRQQEARLETRKASGYKPSSLAEILQRYLKDVTPLKRNTSFEPGVISYNSAISACEKGKRWEIALQLLVEC